MGWDDRERDVEKYMSQKGKPELTRKNVHLAISYKLQAVTTSAREAKVAPRGMGQSSTLSLTTRSIPDSVNEIEDADNSATFDAPGVQPLPSSTTFPRQSSIVSPAATSSFQRSMSMMSPVVVHDLEEVHLDWEHVTVGGILLFLYLELAMVRGSRCP